MTFDDLENQLECCVRDERRLSLQVIMLLAQVMRVKLYAHRGYPSLFKWLVERFKYSEGAAYRRISAAKLIQYIDDAETKLENGDLTLSGLAMAKSAIDAQEKATGRKVNKKEVLEAIEGLPSKQIQTKLFQLLPETAKKARREHTVKLDENTARVTVNLSDEDLQKLATIKDLISHSLPNASNGQMLSLAINELHDQLKTRAAKNQCVKLQSCTYEDEETGHVCGCTYMMEEDHIWPKAFGGSDDPENLRPLCRVHNQLMAEKILGETWANAWRH